MLVKSEQNRSTYGQIVFFGGEVTPPNLREVSTKWADFFTNLSEALKKVIA